MSKIKDLVPDMRLSVEEYYANLFNGDNNEFVKMFEKKNKTAYIMKSDTIESLEDSPYLETTQKTKELFERLKETFFYFIVVSEGDKYNIPDEVFDTIEEAVSYLKENL